MGGGMKALDGGKEEDNAEVQLPHIYVSTHVDAWPRLFTLVCIPSAASNIVCWPGVHPSSVKDIRLPAL
jgi:hypothetical protein